MGGGILGLITALAASGRKQPVTPTAGQQPGALSRLLGRENAGTPGMTGAPPPVPPGPARQPYTPPPPIQIGPQPEPTGPFTSPFAAARALPSLASVFPDMLPGETVAQYLARKGLAGGP